MIRRRVGHVCTSTVTAASCFANLAVNNYFHYLAILPKVLPLFQCLRTAKASKQPWEIAHRCNIQSLLRCPEEGRPHTPNLAARLAYVLAFLAWLHSQAQSHLLQSETFSLELPSLQSSRLPFSFSSRRANCTRTTVVAYSTVTLRVHLRFCICALLESYLLLAVGYAASWAFAVPLCADLFPTKCAHLISTFTRIKTKILGAHVLATNGAHLCAIAVICHAYNAEVDRSC